MPRLPPAALAAALVCLAPACGDPLAPSVPLPSQGPPRALVYDEGGYGGTITEVRLAGDTVVLVARDFFALRDSTVLRRVPSADDWRAFWRAAADAGVGRWPAECRDPNVVDGGGFRYELAWDGGRRAGSYVNAYPTRAGRCVRDVAGTAEARAFGDVVLGLAGVAVPE